MSSHSIEIRQAAKAAFDKAKADGRREVKPLDDESYNAFRRGFQAGYWHGRETAERIFIAYPAFLPPRLFSSAEAGAKWIEQFTGAVSRQLHGHDVIEVFGPDGELCGDVRPLTCGGLDREGGVLLDAAVRVWR